MSLFKMLSLYEQVYIGISFFLLGQHLVTALAETMFGFKTTSWYGDQASYHIQMMGSSNISIGLSLFDGEKSHPIL